MFGLTNNSSDQSEAGKKFYNLTSQGIKQAIKHPQTLPL